MPLSRDPRAASGGRMSGGGAGLMSCVREGSLEPPYRPPQHTSNGEGRTGRFLRGLRRMFRRRKP
ncbi:hypothetical protein RR46_03160 [Papilio xuthus]|uniref:Uncharacterized protein n=1 Tax=Papilio xuthus TaxID=66420 RepID=A0A194Q781_PAPXU|nr:hypothetical protein RR46_03160 [Papilio xuthus]